MQGYLTQLVGFDGASLLSSSDSIMFVMALNLFPVVYFAVSRTLAAVGSRSADVARVRRHAVHALLASRCRSRRPVLRRACCLFALTIEEFGTPAVLGRRAASRADHGDPAARRRFRSTCRGRRYCRSSSSCCRSLPLFCRCASWRAGPSRRWGQAASRRQARARASGGAGGSAVQPGRRDRGRRAALCHIRHRSIEDALGRARRAISASTISARSRRREWGAAALANSLTLGAATAVATGLIGAAAAYAVVRTRFRGKLLLDALTIMPSAVPGVVVAVGLILAGTSRRCLRPPIMSPLHSAVRLLLHAAALSGALRQRRLPPIGDNLEAAARVWGASAPAPFGASCCRSSCRVLVSAMLLVFAVASRELVASVIVAPVGMATVATFIWQQFEQGSVSSEWQ